MQTKMHRKYLEQDTFTLIDKHFNNLLDHSNKVFTIALEAKLHHHHKISISLQVVIYYFISRCYNHSLSMTHQAGC